MGSASTSLANGTFYVLGFTYSGSALAFYHNGAADGTASSSQTLSNFTTVGARGDGTEGFAGDIVALLVYNSVLGSTDRGTVTTYLQTKYAL